MGLTAAAYAWIAQYPDIEFTFTVTAGSLALFVH